MKLHHLVPCRSRAGTASVSLAGCITSDNNLDDTLCWRGIGDISEEGE